MVSLTHLLAKAEPMGRAREYCKENHCLPQNNSLAAYQGGYNLYYLNCTLELRYYFQKALGNMTYKAHF